MKRTNRSPDDAYHQAFRLFRATGYERLIPADYQFIENVICDFTLCLSNCPGVFLMFAYRRYLFYYLNVLHVHTSKF